MAYDCILCDSHHEDSNHLLLNCHVTRKIIVDINAKLSTNIQVNGYGDDFVENLSLLRKHDDFYLLCFLWWEIWNHRNNLIFKSRNCNTNPMQSTIINCTNWVSEYPTVDKKNCMHIKKRTWVSWSKPPQGVYKLNFDASWGGGVGGFTGHIIRDSDGKVCSIGRSKISASSAIQAEAEALLQGLRSALQLGIKKLEIEGDNLSVINAIKGTWTTPWEIKAILEDVRNYIKQVEYINYYYCFREGNQAADFLARRDFGAGIQNCNNQYKDFCTIICKDDLGHTFLRERA